MTDVELLAYFQSEYDKPFTGWDFSYIRDRIKEEKLTWSYETMVLQETRNVGSLLDMGTGGGEFLSTLAPLPQITYATEAYPPNVSIATKHLTPLGVKVVQIDDNDEILPLPADHIELVINRHESYSASEVKRVMQNGAKFITQQVGGENERELNRLLGDKSPYQYAHWNMDYAVKELKQNRFAILEQQEEYPVSEFKDIGAVIYYLKAVPWQVENFSVVNYFNGLKQIQDKISREGSLKIRSHRFLIVAKKLSTICQ